MPEAFLMCRDFRHAWMTEVPYYKVRLEGGVRGALYVERVIVCMRCECRRIELSRVFASRIEKLATHYKRPKGYDVRGKPKGVRVVDLVRFNDIQRALDAPSQ